MPQRKKTRNKCRGTMKCKVGESYQFSPGFFTSFAVEFESGMMNVRTVCGLQKNTTVDAPI
jgi:hypothetical protein